VRSAVIIRPVKSSGVSLGNTRSIFDCPESSHVNFDIVGVFLPLEGLISRTHERAGLES